MLRDVRTSFLSIYPAKDKLTCLCSGIVIDQTRKESFRFLNIDELKERGLKREKGQNEESQEVDDMSKDKSGSEEIEKV
jgi:FHS family L-fucose permease-like MFS transporter